MRSATQCAYRLVASWQDAPDLPLDTNCVQSYDDVFRNSPHLHKNSRITAIIGSLERLLMRLLRGDVTEWGVQHANIHDTALRGKEPFLETAARSYRIEHDTFNGRLIAKILYDLEIFFDTIEPLTLINRLEQTNFPRTQLVIGLISHRAPRLLKLEDAISDPMCIPTGSILAGCTRSTA